MPSHACEIDNLINWRKFSMERYGTTRKTKASRLKGTVGHVPKNKRASPKLTAPSSLGSLRSGDHNLETAINDAEARLSRVNARIEFRMKEGQLV